MRVSIPSVVVVAVAMACLAAAIFFLAPARSEKPRGPGLLELVIFQTRYSCSLPDPADAAECAAAGRLKR